MKVPARFTEIATGTPVLVTTFFHWEGYERISAVEYPSGRTYALPDAELIKYFTIDRPQEVFMQAFGGIDDRPTGEQKARRDLPLDRFDPVTGDLKPADGA